MSLFGSKNYASIVAPLKKMAKELADYISEQSTKIENLGTKKEELRIEFETKTEGLNSDIKVSESEIQKSMHTTQKINDLLAVDLDENGMADVEELPEEPEDSSDSTPK